jgi:hypothetical protein
MALITLAEDFKEFLKSLNSNGVEYLMIGGYAAGSHGYVRATNDLDVWVKPGPENAGRVDNALRAFGFGVGSLDHELFMAENSVAPMGVPPLRIEILTSISGVEFDTCFAERVMIDLGDLSILVISLARLRENKAASGRQRSRRFGQPAELVARSSRLLTNRRDSQSIDTIRAMVIGVIN